MALLFSGTNIVIPVVLQKTMKMSTGRQFVDSDRNLMGAEIEQGLQTE